MMGHRGGGGAAAATREFMSGRPTTDHGTARMPALSRRKPEADYIGRGYSARKTAMSERRRRSRVTSAQAAVIAGSGGKRINCIVRNFSSTGARLELAWPAPVPPTFNLVFEDGGADLACRVKWQQNRDVGVEFQLPRR
jgi:hypothetical protein